MSQRRRLRRLVKTAPGAGFTLRDLLANLLSPAEFAQLADKGDEPCDVQPPQLPSATRCRFRKGHTCPCRFFGDVESGGNA